MKDIKRTLVYLYFKKLKSKYQVLSGSKVKIDLKKSFNTSYYGGPYAYDWYSLEYENLIQKKV